jgi:hypothetical protein
MRFKGEIKPMAARVCLFLAVLFFVNGGLVLCYCPGEFVMAAILAGVAAWCGTRSVRVLSMVLLVLSVAMAGVQARKKARLAELIRRVHQSHVGTNTLDQGTNVPQKK